MYEVGPRDARTMGGQRAEFVRRSPELDPRPWVFRLRGIHRFYDGEGRIGGHSHPWTHLDDLIGDWDGETSM